MRGTRKAHALELGVFVEVPLIVLLSRSSRRQSLGAITLSSCSCRLLFFDHAYPDSGSSRSPCG
jgi:hypothetical protein